MAIKKTLAILLMFIAMMESWMDDRVVISSFVVIRPKPNQRLAGYSAEIPCVILKNQFLAMSFFSHIFGLKFDKAAAECDTMTAFEMCRTYNKTLHHSPISGTVERLYIIRLNFQK